MKKNCEVFEQDARRHAFKLVSETCPVVDNAVEKMTSIIKEKATIKLREALVDEIVNRMYYENKFHKANLEIKVLKQKIKDLKKKKK